MSKLQRQGGTSALDLSGHENKIVNLTKLNTVKLSCVCRKFKIYYRICLFIANQYLPY